ncbi:hypothetical protein KAI46_04085 [bacterium]|nr:hypothetical protein [bacterium]
MIKLRNCFKVNWGRLLFAGVLLFLFQGQVLAESAWFTCKVELAGPGKAFTFVALTDQAETPAFTSKWFILPDDKSRAMLAVALLAINSEKQVVVVVDPDEGPYPEISDIFLQADQE